jgi:CDP-2,3-bis-(O-geranylgeranyl)-sn-glycerol synthase
LTADSTDWFWIGGEWGAAFILGFTLGFACMLGDMAGSFVKRRQGLKREGEVSSKAPLLDTLPFAIFIFLAAAILFNDQVIMHSHLAPSIITIIILTPIIHRSFNILGYRLGLKSVPY